MGGSPTGLPVVVCALGDMGAGAGLHLLTSKVPAADAWQVSATGTKDYVTANGVRVAPALRLVEGMV